MRIEALTALAKNQGNEQIQTAMLAVLRDDQSVQVRMMVLDHLVNRALGLDALEEVIRQGDNATNSAVFLRARELQKPGGNEDWL